MIWALKSQLGREEGGLGIAGPSPDGPQEGTPGWIADRIVGRPWVLVTGVKVSSLGHREPLAVCFCLPLKKSRDEVAIKH